MERALRQAAAEGGYVVAVGEGDGAGTLRQALARCLGTRLVLSNRALDLVAGAYAARGHAVPGRAEQLALVPQGATVLAAPEPGEPGLLAEIGDAVVLALPALPATAVSLARAHLLPRLAEASVGPLVLARTLRLVGLDVGAAEAQLQTALRGAEGVSGHVVDTGEECWARLRVRVDSPPRGEAALAALEPALRGAFGIAWYGIDDETLEVVVGRLLRGRGFTVALAESCTGGLVGHRLTQVAGSSAYFERGFVVYSNEAKQALLGVPESVLREHGAVSAPSRRRHGARRARARGDRHRGRGHRDRRARRRDADQAGRHRVHCPRGPAGHRRRALPIRPRPGGQQGALRSPRARSAPPALPRGELSGGRVSFPRRPVCRRRQVEWRRGGGESPACGGNARAWASRRVGR